MQYDSSPLSLLDWLYSKLNTVWDDWCQPVCKTARWVWWL